MPGPDREIQRNARKPIELRNCVIDKGRPQIYNENNEPTDVDSDGKQIVWCNPQRVVSRISTEEKGSGQSCWSHTFPVTDDFACRVQDGTLRERIQTWDEFSQNTFGIQATFWAINSSITLDQKDMSRLNVLTHMYHKEVWSNNRPCGAKISETGNTDSKGSNCLPCALGNEKCIGYVSQVVVGHLSVAFFKKRSQKDGASANIDFKLPPAPAAGGSISWTDEATLESMAQRAVYAGVIGYTVQLTPEGTYAADAYEVALKYPSIDSMVKRGNLIPRNEFIKELVCGHIKMAGSGPEEHKDGYVNRAECESATEIGILYADTKVVDLHKLISKKQKSK
jgi:hypothetical protein